MAESNVIKEFLVALGFKSDEASLKKFTNGIATATKSVVGLALAIEGTAVTVSIGVARWASSLEALYFASIRTGSAASNLKAFDRAAQSFGTSAGEALASVEGLARFMRNNPGGEGMINGWLMGMGLSTRDANGRLKETTEILQEIGRLFANQQSHGQQYLASQLASQWGIDERTMFAIEDPNFGRKFAEEQRKFAGVAAMAERAHRFMEEIRRLGDEVERFGFKVQDALQNRLGLSVESITTWLEKNGDRLAATVVNGLQQLFNLAEILKPALVWLYDKFVEMDKATDGWSTKILALLVALKFLGGTEIITGLAGLTIAFARVAVAAAGAAGAISGATTAAAIGTGIGLGWAIQKYVPGWADFFGSIGSKLFDYTHRTEDATRRWINRGYTPAQAAGIVANEQAESNFRENASGDGGKAYGAFQFHKSWQDKFRRWSGKDIAGSSLADQEDFVNYELRHGELQSLFKAMQNAPNNAQLSAEMFTSMFERPADTAGEAARRGRNAAIIHQNVTIHIDGAQSPEATGRAVNDALRNGLAPVQ